MKKLILSIIAVGTAVLLGMAWAANAAPVTQGIGGGTGLSTSTNTQNGNCLQQLTGTPFLTWTIGACGSGSGTGTVAFYANGQLFTTTSTINFQQGTNVTITTSSNGTYTISATGGGSGGLASTTPYVVGNLVIVSSSGALATLSSSTYYLATNPNNYISSSTGNALYYPLSSNPAGYVTSSTAPSSTVGPSTSTYVAYFNGSSTVTGTSTFTVSNTSGLVTLQLLNGIAYASQYAGSDAGAKINAAYAALPSGGGTIYASCGVNTFTTPIVFGTADKPVLLIGCGGAGFYDNGGTTLIWGNTTGTAITYNTNAYSSSGLGIKTLSLVGNVGIGQPAPSTAPNATAATVSVGIYAGGSNGATGMQVDGVNITGFGIGYIAGENEFLMNVTNSSILKDGVAIQNLATTGAVGENMRVSNSVLADSQSNGSSISTFCVYLQQSGNIQWTFTNNSFDDCQIYSTQYGGTANIIRLIGNHFEDPNTGQSPYYFVAGQSTQNTVGGMVWQSIGNDYMQDQSNGQSAVLNGADFYSTGDTVEVNAPVNTPMTRFIVNQDSNDIASWSNLSEKYANSSASAAITYVAGTTSYSQNGLVFGTSTAAYTIGTSTVSFGATVNILSNNLVDASGNKYSTSTSGGSGGIGSTTINYLPFAVTSSTFGNSNAYQIPSTPSSTTYSNILFKQTATGSAGGTFQNVTTTLSNVSSSDLLITSLDFTGTGTPTITDDNGSITFIASTTWNGSARQYEYYEANAASGTHHIHLALTVSENFVTFTSDEYGNVATSSPLDSKVFNTGNGGSIAGSGNLSATALPNEMFYTICQSAGGSCSSPSGYGIRNGTAASADNSTGTQLAAGTITSSTWGYSGGGINWLVFGSSWQPTVSSTTPFVLKGDISIGTTTDLGATLGINGTLNVIATSTFSGNVSTTIANALHLSNAAGILTAYAGSSCATGSVATSISATGTVTCLTTSTILTGYSTSTSSGGSGTVTTSTAVSINNFPFWNSTNGSGLNGTSSLSQVGTTGVNVTGTITVTATSTLGGNITLNGTNQKITSPSTISIIGSGGVFLDNAALTSQLSVNSNGSFTIAPSFSSGTILFDAASGNLERLDTSLITNQRVTQFPDASGIICLTTTCTGGGGVATTTTFSAGFIPVVSSSLALTNSRLSQSGNTVTIAASTTNIGSATTTFQIFSNGHINSSGTVAQVSSCGTNPSITGTDSWGNVTVGSVSATSCTITFANAYANVPACVVQSKTGTIAIGYTVTTSTIVVTNAALTGDGLAYWCGALE